MKILAIETSCDETAVALLEGTGDEHGASFRVLGNGLLSQIDLHKQYGGVFPMMAKRAHAANLVPLLSATLEEAGMLREDVQNVDEERLRTTLEREPELAEALLEFLKTTERPDIDAIAVTHGPGLEPALWVGVNLARALSSTWNIPIAPVNHMEGHLLAGLATANGKEITITTPTLPILALLVSGGHTELVLMRDWLSYTVLGQTRDDAAGEAFDKVARMMGLPYPGGPEISRLAEEARKDATPPAFELPRPMIDTKDYDFSFSGLKTAVLYLLKAHGELSDTEKQKLAEEFEDAVVEVLYAKSSRAIEETGAKIFSIGGGVSANNHLRSVFAESIAEDHPHTALRIPDRSLSTDNAIMIGIAGYFRTVRKEFATDLKAHGTLSL
jgi:N6-L-threonylcarbamoyladenine synthase